MPDLLSYYTSNVLWDVIYHGYITLAAKVPAKHGICGSHGFIVQSNTLIR